MGRTNPSAANNTAAFSQLQAENDALKKENRDLRQKLERMNELLLNAQRARFGPSSEKQDYVMPNQVGIFNEAEAEQDPKAPEPTEETILVPAHTRKPKRTMDELAAGLPVKEILITLPEEELICDVCGSKMAMIGKKLVSRRLEVIPRQCSLLEYYAVTYACKPCEEKTGYAHLVTTVTPPFLLKHSLASASTAADIYGAEVCGRSAAGTPGKDLGARRSCSVPRHHGQLGHSDGTDLAEAAIPHAEEGIARQQYHLCG